MSILLTKRMYADRLGLVASSTVNKHKPRVVFHGPPPPPFTFNKYTQAERSRWSLDSGNLNRSPSLPPLKPRRRAKLHDAYVREKRQT